MSARNFIAKAVTRIRPQIVPDKRQRERDRVAFEEPPETVDLTCESCGQSWQCSPNIKRMKRCRYCHGGVDGRG